MALTKAARSKIASLVQQAKILLMKEVEEQLQQYYGIRPDGMVLMVEQLTTAESEIIYTAHLLRQRLEYLRANLADKKNADTDAVRQLVREQAFTILNRFASLRMAEERSIISETIRKEYNSDGFLVFDSITGQGQTASQYIRYKWYLYAIFDELALDLPSLFDRYSPHALLFPSEQAMNRLLGIINKEEITIHLEKGLPAINLWKEDETIGWIYQYYNSQEEITAMREACDAPRNSQELAARNQFFTPRYVVQFLTDNSLGRIWYEMTGGNTVLKTACPYLIIRKGEVLLKKDENKPENGNEDAEYIEYRVIKDPREILMLDPACGSMHFGLYCFDLFEQIYLEAWDNHLELLMDLRNSITRQAFVQQIPELIIRHNIHGVDIDPRALQIAGLSLWLRAQKSFDKQNLPADQRPQITRSNLVLAEPMPGSVETLSQVIQTLDAPMRKLVLAIWEKMKLAGETGLLLRIEEEIDQTIKEIATELGDESLATQLTLGEEENELQAAEKAARYATKKYRDSFLDSAEVGVLDILKQLAKAATDGDAYQKLLFADDTARGFAFIELCRNKYDVVLMNPPFGSTSINTKKYVNEKYPLSKDDLATVFIDRMVELGHCSFRLGCISTRTIFFLGTYINWRRKTLIERNAIEIFADLGIGVLDAMVETSAYIIRKGNQSEKSIFFRLTKSKNKDERLREFVFLNEKKDIYYMDVRGFKPISNEPFCYWIDKKTQDLFISSARFESLNRKAYAGLQTGDNFRFVLNIWETKNRGTIDYPRYLSSQESYGFYLEYKAVINWRNNGNELKNFTDNLGNPRSYQRGEQIYFKYGISWSYRTSKFQPHIIPLGHIPSHGRFLCLFENANQLLYTCAFWNSELVDYWLKLSMEADSGNPKFINGIVNQLPYPNLPLDLQKELINITQEQFFNVKEIYRINEKSVAFTSNAFIKADSLNQFVKNFIRELQERKKAFLKNQLLLNDLIYKHFQIDQNEKENIKEIIAKTGMPNDEQIFDTNEKQLFNDIFSIIVGCTFNRWDIRIIKSWNKNWIDEGIFKNHQHSPFLFDRHTSTLDLAFPEFHQDIKTIHNQAYPVNTLNEVADVTSLVKSIRDVIHYFWADSSSAIEFEFLEHYGVKNLHLILENVNRFFDFHLKDYSLNKRVAPIYWPLSTASGSYTLWIYYPKLTDQTLYKAVNDFIIPKQEEVAEHVKKLENNPHLYYKGKKELQDLQDLLYELKEMEKNLLSVAALPYKPNHDDGVLITAAPLYKFFKHSKWRAATEACWKDLEKGVYDWAHLAYKIWPDRVTKKCKKDLSMAIAHGFEEMCEVKPKEKKEKTAAKPAKKNIQGKLIEE